MSEIHANVHLPQSLGLLLGHGSRVQSAVLIREGPRARVYRIAIEPRSGVVASVILKQITDEGARGYTDWASLAFLNDLPGTASLVPQFLGGDATEGHYLLADLGPSTTLEDLLLDPDPGPTTSAFEALARAYAHLHGGTLSGEGKYGDLRARLPRGSDLGRLPESAQWTGARPALDSWLSVLEVTAPSGLDADLWRIAQRFADPGPFLVFTHGDPAPSNNHVSGKTVRLLDFEYGAYRHALYDLTAWSVLCPLPQSILNSMQLAYREVLSRDLPQIADEAVFAVEWATLCAYRALAMFSWIPTQVMARNYEWAGDWTAREALVVAVSRLEDTLRGVTQLRAVWQLAADLKCALLERFPEHRDALPNWPAWAALRSPGGR